METTAPMTFEAYRRSSWEPDAEYVDGQIEERAQAELDHSRWHGAILFYLNQNKKKWSVRALPSLHTLVAPTRCRVPDVVLLDGHAAIEQIVTHAPIAVFEVLSPEDTVFRLKRKLEDYRNMGIPEIWVIDPQDNTYYRYEDLQLIRKQTFVHAAKNILFDMNEIKNLLD